MSSGGYISLYIKEVLLPRIEIYYPDGLRSIDTPPSSEMYSPSPASCVSTDVMEGSLAGNILKPGGGAVFVRVCSSAPIWRDLLSMVAVSSSLLCVLV